MMRQFELVELVKSYDPGADEGLLDRAYVYSIKAHGTQLRASGDPYFSHPIEVAGLLAGMKLDTASIVTGLLHDTVEDTVRDARRHRAGLFGKEIAHLVDGVTKLSRLELQSGPDEAGREFQKARAGDVRGHPRSSSSSSRTASTTCARSASSRTPTSAAASRARRWKSMRRSPSASACTA